MSGLVFVAVALGVWRVTTFITIDKLTMPLRDWIRRRHPAQVVFVDGAEQRIPHPAVVLVNCTRCLSVWVAGVAVGALWAAGMVDGWRWFLLGWAGCAGAAAVAADAFP